MFNRGQAAPLIGRYVAALVVLLVLFAGGAAIQVTRVASQTLEPSAPAATALPVEASSMPFQPQRTTDATSPGPVQTAPQTVAPAQTSPDPAAATALPTATPAPRPTVPAAPSKTADPSHDVHAVAPELGLPGVSPPPGRD